VAEVIPEAVAPQPNGDLGISLPTLVPVLVEAIKELAAQVEDLREQVGKPRTERPRRR
jgi:hypothetical protein